MARTEQEDAAAVEALKACWDGLWRGRPERDSVDDFEALVADWAPHRALDPIACETDLLSPLGQELDEVAHTRALAYLLDPHEAHHLGVEPLHRFLDAVQHVALQHAPELASLLDSLVLDGDEAGLVATVIPERTVEVETPQGRVLRRTDLWVEVPADNPKLLLVVENKIEDVAREGQLAAYEVAIAARLGQLDSRPLVAKVYLTLHGDSPPQAAGGEGWLPLDYTTLGMAWVTILDAVGHSASSSFLRLYLATIFQKLKGLSWREELSRLQRADIASYLRARLERQP